MIGLTDECPICGSTHGELRFQVAIRQKTVRGQPLPHAWTYCPKCCTPLEIDQWRYEQEHPTRARPAPRSR